MNYKIKLKIKKIKLSKWNVSFKKKEEIKMKNYNSNKIIMNKLNIMKTMIILICEIVDKVMKLIIIIMKFKKKINIIYIKMFKILNKKKL